MVKENTANATVIPYIAEGNLGSSQFYIVQLGTQPNSVKVGSANCACLGVLKNTATTGQTCAIQIDGVSRVVSDGSGTNISKGDKLVSDASGKAVKASLASGENNLIGYAQDPSTADGIIIGVSITVGRD